MAPKCKLGYRHVVAFLILVSTMTAYFGRVNLSTAIVAMVRDEPNVELPATNSSLEPLDDVCPVRRTSPTTGATVGSGIGRVRQFSWNQKTQGMLLGAFFYGYFAFQLVSGRLAELVGPRILCSFGLSATGLLNLLLPALAEHRQWFFASRVLMGASQAAIFPCCYTLVSRWIPDHERSTVNALMVVGANLGIVLASSTAGYLSQSGGWPSVFYVTGTAALLVSLVYLGLVRDEPIPGWLVSKAELDYITANIERPVNLPKRRPPIPWCRILTNRNVWAGAVTHFTNAWTMNMIVLKLPDYMHHVLHLPLQRNGFFTSTIYCCEALSLFLNGMLADHLIKRGACSKPTVRKLFQAVSAFGSGLCLLWVPSTNCDENHFLALMVLCMLMVGAQSGGLTSLPSDLTTEFSATIFALFNTFGAVNGFLCPYLIGYLMDRHTRSRKHQWAAIMYGTGALKIFGGIVFLMFVNATRQDWDDSQTKSPTTIGGSQASSGSSEQPIAIERLAPSSWLEEEKL